MGLFNKDKKNKGLPVQPTSGQANGSSSDDKKVEKISFDEIKRAKEELNVSRGLAPNQEEINRKIIDDAIKEEIRRQKAEREAEEAERAQSQAEQAQAAENDSATAPQQEQAPAQPEVRAEEPIVEAAPEHTSQVDYREKIEIDKKLKENDSVSRIDEDEINKLKAELGIVDESYNYKPTKQEKEAALAGGKEDKATAPEEKEEAKDAEQETQPKEDGEQKAEEQQEEKKEPEVIFETKSVEPQKKETFDEKQFHKKELEKIDQQLEKNKESKRRSKVTNEQSATPPDKSLPDDITDEDINQVLEEQEKQEILKEEEAENESYEGMTEEEIADAKERKRRFLELKQRYNSKETDENGEIGDYRKNLDFSVNTSVKRFKLKPPKKPFIIAAIILAVLLAATGVIVYFILNKPPAPIVLSKLELSTSSIYQVKDEEVDLRGLYAIKTYSDGSVQNEQLKTNMISRTSANIVNLVITTADADTFVEFTIEGKTAKLDILVKDFKIEPESFKFEVYQPSIRAGQELKFENIFMYAVIRYTYAGQDTEDTDTLWLKDFDLVTITDASGKALTKTATGFVIPSTSFGSNQLNVTLTYGGLEYHVSFTLSVAA